eukprot:s938_g14.t1
MGNLPPPAPEEMVVEMQRRCCAPPIYEVPDSLKKFLSESDIADMNRQFQMMECIGVLCALVFVLFWVCLAAIMVAVVEEPGLWNLAHGAWGAYGVAQAVKMTMMSSWLSSFSASKMPARKVRGKNCGECALGFMPPQGGTTIGVEGV